MSGPAVVIGYILLIPSVIGMLMSLYMVGSFTYVRASETRRHRNESRAQMHNRNVPDALIEKVLAGGEPSAPERAALGSWQQSALDNALRDRRRSEGLDAFGEAGMNIATGVALGVGVLAFIGGVFGWLLVMKKRVLQCDHCMAVVAAS